MADQETGTQSSAPPREKVSPGSGSSSWTSAKRTCLELTNLVFLLVCVLLLIQTVPPPSPDAPMADDPILAWFSRIPTTGLSAAIGVVSLISFTICVVFIAIHWAHDPDWKLARRCDDDDDRDDDGCDVCDCEGYPADGSSDCQERESSCTYY